jgi:hypothetical protein
MVAMWLRQIWSRYVLLALLWLIVFAFSVPLMGFTDSLQEFRRLPVFALLGGITVYLSALLLLTLSHGINRLLHPGSASPRCLGREDQALGVSNASPLRHE